jgi:2-hydroxy-3-keto-5-methylthiopentenyl-1-phosphate phosphatase
MQYYLDLDGFLKTDVDFSGVGSGVKSFFHKGGRYPYVIRPYAKEFIEKLKSKGNVAICTLASRKYAEYFVREIGVTELIDAIYSRENLDNIPPPVEYVLYENDEPIGRGKMSYIEKRGAAFKGGRLVVVDTYDGNDSDDVLLKEMKKL